MGGHDTKWRIGFETGGKKLGGSITRSKRWQIVPFPGPNGGESAGVVDLLAIRRDHRTKNRIIKRGDLFEIILIQVKGGGARNPSPRDIKRLRAVAARYHTKAVVLANWKKGSQPIFFRLQNLNGKKQSVRVKSLLLTFVTRERETGTF